MTFKKGDRVQNEDGEAGEILFVDKGGLEAQVAFQRISLKVRTELLRKLTPEESLALPAEPPKKARRAPLKRTRAGHAPKS